MKTGCTHYALIELWLQGKLVQENMQDIEGTRVAVLSAGHPSLIHPSFLWSFLLPAWHAPSIQVRITFANQKDLMDPSASATLAASSSYHFATRKCFAVDFEQIKHGKYQ